MQRYQNARKTRNLCNYDALGCVQAGLLRFMILEWARHSLKLCANPIRGHSTTTWTECCHFLTPPCVDSFYTMNVDKNRHFYTLNVDKNRHFLTPSPPHLMNLYRSWKSPARWFRMIHLTHSMVASFSFGLGQEKLLEEFPPLNSFRSKKSVY